MPRYCDTDKHLRRLDSMLAAIVAALYDEPLLHALSEAVGNRRPKQWEGGKRRGQEQRAEWVGGSHEKSGRGARRLFCYCPLTLPTCLPTTHQISPYQQRDSQLGMSSRDVQTRPYRVSKACENCRLRRTKCEPPYPCRACRVAHLSDCHVREKARPARSVETFDMCTDTTVILAPTHRVLIRSKGRATKNE